MLVYLCNAYPHPDELSKARLTKMVYLADWRSAITRGRTVTDIPWEFNHYGPYVSDVVELARRDPTFQVVQTFNEFGNPKDLIRIIRKVKPSEELDADDREILDYVVNQTASMPWAPFIKLVYSTWPVLSRPRYSRLDLVQLANEYVKGMEADDMSPLK